MTASTGTATWSDLPVGEAGLFDHLFRLTDESGLFEHAELTRPRTEHGYCVDDVARGLVMAAREPAPSPRLTGLARMYLEFVGDARTSDGSFFNRRSFDLRSCDLRSFDLRSFDRRDAGGRAPKRAWNGKATLEDCWGRALWGLGTAAARMPALSSEALAHFDAAAARRSPWSRAMAFAALGAAEVLAVRPDHDAARALLADAAALIGRPGSDQQSGSESGAEWQWPEPRLRYANAILPEVLLAAGSLLGDRRAESDGLVMLGWLLRTETAGDHLSVTPVGGWAAGEQRPGFDQQPIEVAALADACARAFDRTADERWREGVRLAAAWFLGANDVGVAMYDPVSGGGCDGLEVDGRNENQGAESTLAMISVFQQARRVLPQQGER